MPNQQAFSAAIKTTHSKDLDSTATTNYNLELLGTRLKQRLRSQCPRTESGSALKRKLPAREHVEEHATKRARNDDGKNGLPSETAPWCHPALHLAEMRRTEIAETKMLDDDVVRAFQTLLQKAFPGVSGWQAPALAVHEELGYSQNTGLSVQIHNNLSGHWLTSARTRAGIFVADSLLTSPNATIARQLIDIYQRDDQSFIDVTFLPCQWQIGSLQCGDFAICNAAIFAMCIDTKRSQLEKVFSSAHFNQNTLRKHMLDCVKAGQFLAPLQLHSAPRVLLRQPTTFRIDCASRAYHILN